jgi:protein-L-isoaspartate(D-aspartate) O-methyltransferase
MLDAVQSRRRMVAAQLIDRGISDERVLDAMGCIPREAFVAPSLKRFAYEDSPLRIEEGQTISQPFIVALMLEAATLLPGDAALEIGTGSGYAAAVMARLCQTVVTIERHTALAEAASRRFEELGLRNVSVHVDDGSKGWPEGAPFDAIIVAAAAPTVPVALRDQLRIGGRLVMPVGGKTQQRLVKITRLSAKEFDEERLSDVRFVPLVGEQGWTGIGQEQDGRG